MNCILYLTDFTERSKHTLGYLLPVADELRARIIFVHVIDADSPKLKVNKQEEKEFSHLFNALKHSVVMYGFKNNCEMLTGHLLLKGDLVANIKSVMKTMIPYAIVIQHDFANKARALPSKIYDQLMKTVNAPVMIIPEFAEYAQINAIGYFSGIYKTVHNELNDLMYKIRMFKSKLFTYYLKDTSVESEVIMSELNNQFPESVSRLSIEEIEPKFIAVRISKLIDEMGINIAAFNAGDKIFDDVFRQGENAAPFLMKTPVLIYPEEFKLNEN